MRDEDFIAELRFKQDPTLAEIRAVLHMLRVGDLIHIDEVMDRLKADHARGIDLPKGLAFEAPTPAARAAIAPLMHDLDAIARNRGLVR